MAIENSDIVVSASGGYLNGNNSPASNLYIHYATLPLRLAESLGKTVVMAPESFGPLGNNWQRYIVRKTLNATQLICVREEKSYQFLESLGVKKGLMIRTVDSGFAHLNETVSENKEQDGEIRIGITARNWLPQKQQAEYESALANFIATAEKTYGAKTILVPQVTSVHDADDDRIVETRIKNLAVQAGANPLQIIDEIDHYDIKKLYSSFTFTVGTRFHSVIFSLTSYVPAIAIEYEHKTSGIMHDLGLDEWVIKIEDVTAEKLETMFAKLVKEREFYRKHLILVLPPYIEKANETPRLIQGAYERHVG